MLPASPNWYCSGVSDSNENYTHVFGARHDVFVFDCQIIPPTFQGVFLGHREKVTAVCLGHSGKHLSLCGSGSEDGRVKVWDVHSKEVQLEHNQHERADLVVSGDETGALVSWQLEEDRQTVCRLQEKSPIFCMAMSPTEATIVAVGYKTGVIQLVDVKKGGWVVHRLRGHDEEVHSLAWCPAPGEDFKPASTQYDIADLETFGVETAVKPKKTTEFGDEGWLLASGSRDKTIRVWSTSKGRQLLVMKVPNMGARREKGEDGGKSRLWLTVCWPTGKPHCLLSSSASGELLTWDISKVGKERCQVFPVIGGQCHIRPVFTISTLGPDATFLCSISMDRQILYWDMKARSSLGALPTLGGYVYVAKTSPLDPGRIALGIGDGMIRVWNLNSSSDLYDLSTFWQGIRSKVTALCWHPSKESLLAYGTEDGRVGIYDVLSNKPPNISTTYHRRTVYVVAWGPPCPFSDECGKNSYFVYSVGDGVILEHDPYKLAEEARSINKLIQDNNSDYRARLPVRSELSWKPDFTVAAVGNDDGSVELFSVPDFRLLAVIQVQHKLVNTIQWHPSVTMATPGGSPCRYWLAIGSNESAVCVVDVGKVFAGPSCVVEREELSAPLRISDCLKRLEGHSNRVTGLAWSHHSDGQLASVSYDGNALVWDVVQGSIRACFSGHLGKLLCVQWNGLDPDEVITGGDDFCLHRWRVSENAPVPGQLDPKKKKKSKSKFAKAKTDGTGDKPMSETVPSNSDTTVAITTEEQAELEAMLEEKRKELLEAEKTSGRPTAAGDAGPVGPERLGASGDGHVDSRGLALDTADAAGGGLKDRRKRKAKSMFPVTGKLENRGKQFILEDVVTLAKIIYGCHGEGQDEQTFDQLEEEKCHLGLFLDRRNVYICLDAEGQHHRNHDNMEYYYQLEIWKGNINGVLRVARQREELSDWLVAMAPMASFDTWTAVCEDYALQLESDGQYHKAASYFLACHKVYQAVAVFKRHKLFKEAIALAKVRLSPLDPVLEELYTLWAQQLTKDGNFEQAAKCHLAMKQVQDAAKLLARRYDQSSLKTAAHISMIANDKQQGLMYTQKIVQQHLLQTEWSEAFSYLREQKGLQIFVATSSIHQMLLAELSTLVPGLLDVDSTKFYKWDKQATQRVLLPDFILDREDVDPMSPWQPHLIEGHTFPHHVLRTWYSHLDVPMDTASLEDMYKTLCLLHAGRQSQVELAPVLIQVCVDLTLFMLSLLMSETPTALSHLLQAVGSLHEVGQLKAMQGLLQLFLPQGPKYILKLQQEVTAMRVMISMDSHSHVDGASKVHSLKRYLTDLKEDGTVSNSSLRCRELDCLRAYYYVTILNFLRDSCDLGEITEETADELVKMENLNAGENLESNVDESQNVTGSGNSSRKSLPPIESSQSEDQSVSTSPQASVIEENQSGVSASEQNGAGSPSQSAEAGTKPSAPQESKVDQKLDSPTSSKSTITSGSVTSEKTMEKRPDTGIPVALKPASSQPSQDLVPALPRRPSASGVTTDTGVVTHSSSPDTTGQSKGGHTPLNVNYFSITVSKLNQLSQGLLWDLQAKRHALTETLGYIHKAISQLLLSKKPKVTPSSEADATGTALQGDNSVEPQRDNQSATGIDRQFPQSNQDASNSGNPDGETQPEGAEAALTQVSNTGDSSHRAHLCEHLQGVEHTCHIGGHAEHMINLHVPHMGDVSLPAGDNEPEFNASLFDVCASCELLHKSRKIFWEDEPHLQVRQDSGGSRDMTNITNPAKYINVADEWYNMPVDQKYFKPYVTMAILKDEQEFVMHELKRGPDTSQSVFPSPLESVKYLLDVSRGSAHIANMERQEFAQKVITWALNFAVTTQQKQTFVGLLQSHLES